MTMKRKRLLSHLALQAALLLSSMIIVVPLLIMVFGSFKDPIEVTAFNLALPKTWHFENYKEVIEKGHLARGFFNSFFMTTLAVLLTLFLTSMASFILARQKTKLSVFFYYFFFIGILLPMQTIPTIQVFKWLNLYGSYAGAVILFCTLNISFGCFLYTGFIRGIPRVLDEAAFLEGASAFQVFFRVIFPLLKPVSITLVIMIFMGVWNDINIPLYFLTNPEKWTMPLSVYNFFGKYSGSNWNYVFADLVLSALPVVILYLFAQKYLVSGLTAGAVKE